jgi:hypothetical protein
MGGRDGGGAAGASCQATCTGEELCTTDMDCSMGQRCLRLSATLRVCGGMIRDGGFPPFDAARD